MERFFVTGLGPVVRRASPPQIEAAATELRDAGAALQWLERARLSVMGGAAEYERGYDNVRALVGTVRDARAAHDAAVSAVFFLVEGPEGQILGARDHAPADATRMAFELCQKLLEPDTVAPAQAAPPVAPADAPPENPEG